MSNDRKVEVKFKDDLFNCSLEGEKQVTGASKGKAVYSRNLLMFSLTPREAMELVGELTSKMKDMEDELNDIIKR